MAFFMRLKRKVHYYRENEKKGYRYRVSTLIDVDIPEASMAELIPAYRIGNETIYTAQGQYWSDTRGLTVKMLTDAYREGDLPFHPATTLDTAISNARKEASTYLAVDYEKAYRRVEKPSYAIVIRGSIPVIEAVYIPAALEKLPKFCKLYPPEMKSMVLAQARQIARMISTVPEEEIQISRANEIQIIGSETETGQSIAPQPSKLAPGFVLESLDNPTMLAAFIAGHERTTPYCGINDQGEKVRLSVSAVHGMEVHTNQSNGWIRVTFFDPQGFFTGESYDGKWNKEAD